jgi:hypothetical protein
MADLECQDGVGRASAEGVGVGEDAGLEMEMNQDLEVAIPTRLSALVCKETTWQCHVR